MPQTDDNHGKILMTEYEKVLKELRKANRNTVIVMILSSAIAAFITVFFAYDTIKHETVGKRTAAVLWCVVKECWVFAVITILFIIMLYYAIQTYKNIKQNMRSELDGIFKKTGMTEEELAVRLETMENIAYLMYVDDDYLINFPTKSAVDMHKAADVEILTFSDSENITKYYVELRLADTSSHRLRICSKKRSAEALADKIRKYIKK